MNYLSISVLLLFSIACNSNRSDKLNSNSADSLKNEILADQSITKEEVKKNSSGTILKSQEINGVKISFVELSKQQYDSVKLKTISTPLPLTELNKEIVQTDSCIIIQLENKKLDSLCDLDDGGYFETYSLNGFWEEVNHLVISFANWEEQYDFLVDLQTGNQFILGPEYRLSPDKKLLFTYVNSVDAPIYSAYYSLLEITDLGINEYFTIEPDGSTILEAEWTNNEKLLLSAASTDENYEVVSQAYYLMEISLPKKSINVTEQYIGTLALSSLKPSQFNLQISKAFPGSTITKHLGRQDGPDFTYYKVSEEDEDLFMIRMNSYDSTQIDEIWITSRRIKDEFGIEVGTDFSDLRNSLADYKLHSDLHMNIYISKPNSNLSYRLALKSFKMLNDSTMVAEDYSVKEWQIESAEVEYIVIKP